MIDFREAKFISLVFCIAIFKKMKFLCQVILCLTHDQRGSVCIHTYIHVLLIILIFVSLARSSLQRQLLSTETGVNKHDLFIVKQHHGNIFNCYKTLGGHCVMDIYGDSSALYSFLGTVDSQEEECFLGFLQLTCILLGLIL